MADVVLLHGAGTGGWLWEAVAADLEARGHAVTAPTLIGIGERLAEGGPHTSLSEHVREVADLLRTRPGVRLVGFSYGGLVAGIVAAQDPDRVRRLVYVDGFLPQPGRAFLDALPPEVGAQMQQLADAHGDGWRLPPMPLERVGGLGAVSPDVDRGWLDAMLARRGPHPLVTYREPVPAMEAFPPTRTVYVACTDKPPGDPMGRIAEAARAAGIPVRALHTGHFAMLTQPAELAALLDELARTP